MTPKVFIKIAINPALSLLPDKMNTTEAKALILAICLQESNLNYREQVRGPARSFAQFELTGIRGVLKHPSSKAHIKDVLIQLNYNFNPNTSYRAIKHNDILCVCYSRLLLWTLPQALPGENAVDDAWNQYIAAWRPGKPHPETWDDKYQLAWKKIKENNNGCFTT